MGTNNVVAPADRERLQERLREIAPPLADIYAGAVALLAVPELPGRAYFLAHAAREIANGLPEWFTGVTAPREGARFEHLAKRWRATLAPADLVEQPAASPTAGGVLIPKDIFDELSRLFADRSSRATARDSVSRLFTALGPGNRYLPADLNRFIGEWMGLRKWFEGHVHARRALEQPQPDEREATEFFLRFERWLDSLIQGFHASKRELETQLANATPDRLPELMPFLVRDEHRRYFFEKLAATADPAWLEAVQAAGLFDHPPREVLREEGQQTETHAVWPAAAYLVRMATVPAAQETVAAIAAQILSRPVENHLLERDLADVALALPPALSSRLSRPMRSWGDDFSDQLARKLAALAVNLARAGETADALSLMRGLLSSRRQPRRGDAWPADAEPTFGRWGLASIIELRLPDFVVVAGVAGFKVVCEALDSALRSTRDDSETWEDYSGIWRPMAEDENIEQGSAPEMLACALFRAASTLAHDVEATRDVVRVLEQYHWRFFRRVSQVLLLRSIASAADLVQAQLLQRGEWDSFDREYRMLLEAGFPHIDAQAQLQLLDWLQAGPDRNRVREVLASQSGREPTAAEVAARVRLWQWRRLGPLARHVRGEALELKSQLAEEFGGPRPSDQPDVRMAGGTVPRASALQPGESGSLGIEEIANRLLTFRIDPREGPIVPDDGTTLLEAVAAEPVRFAGGALWFRGLKPAYARAFFAGLERSLRDQAHFDWGPVLEFASWVVAQRPVERSNLDPYVEETAWEWTRAALARLLLAGLARPETAPPQTARAKVWSLIDALDGDPPLNRAEAVEAAIRYALWLEPAGSGLFETAPEAARFLEHQLNRMPSTEVHSRFGELLTHLALRAPRWTRDNLQRLLPEAAELWAAAWKAHLGGAAPPLAAFDVLRDSYRRAVDDIGPSEPDHPLGVRTDAARRQELLAEHLIILYGRGVLEVTGEGALLDRFFEVADSALRRHALWHAADSIRHRHEEYDGPGPDFEVPLEVLERFRALWERRVRRVPSKPEITEEFPAFGSWFATARFEDDWALDHLERVLERSGVTEDGPFANEAAVVRRLAELADAHPVRVVLILGHILNLTQNCVGVYGWLEAARDIIQKAVRTGDSAAHHAAVGILDRLGSLGFRDVREIVGSSTDLDDPLAIPYFLWDQPLTVAQFRARLEGSSQAERDRLLGLLLREAADEDVWKFTTPDEARSRWGQIERYLGPRLEPWRRLLTE